MSIYEQLRAAGLDVRDARVPGYQGRAYRPAGTLIHHTGSPAGSGNVPCLHLCQVGRVDLAGPLCQVLIGRDGSIWSITDGYANHAGLVDLPWSNTNLVGVEIENDGKGETYSDAAYLAAVAVARVLSYPQFGHKEICLPRGRKIDPSFDMDYFRSVVAATPEPGMGFEQADRDILLTINHYVQKVFPQWLAEVEARLTQRIADAAAGVHAALAAYDGEEDAQFQAVLDAITAGVPGLPGFAVEAQAVADAVADELAQRLES